MRYFHDQFYLINSEGSIGVVTFDHLPYKFLYLTYFLVAYYFLVYSNIYNESSSYFISSVSSEYNMKILILGYFTLYNIKLYNFQWLNPTMKVLVLTYSLEQQRAYCTSPYTHLIVDNILQYIYYSFGAYTIPNVIFVYIHYYFVTSKHWYKCILLGSPIYLSNT